MGSLGISSVNVCVYKTVSGMEWGSSLNEVGIMCFIMSLYSW